MIKVSLEEINNKFDELIDEKTSREEVSNWASKRMFAHDDDLLEFHPTEYRPVIWRGIKYLIGVDLLNPDGSYFHVKDDFIDYKNQLFDDKSDLVNSLQDRAQKFQELEKEISKLREEFPDESEEFFLRQLDKIIIRKGLTKDLDS